LANFNDLAAMQVLFVMKANEAPVKKDHINIHFLRGSEGL